MQKKNIRIKLLIQTETVTAEVKTTTDGVVTVIS